MGHKLTCDEDNSFLHLPCVCNQNTRDPSELTDHSVVNAAQTSSGSLDASNTIDTSGIAGMGGPNNTSSTSGGATTGPQGNMIGSDYFDVLANSTSTDTSTQDSSEDACLPHSYALEIMDALSAREQSDPDCLVTGNPPSCSGCCRVGIRLYCNDSGIENAQHPCVCSEEAQPLSVSRKHNSDFDN